MAGGPTDTTLKLIQNTHPSAQTMIKVTGSGATLDTTLRWRVDATDRPVAVLSLMMFLLPALGVPSELMLQDTLKSAIAAFGTLLAALLFFWQQYQCNASLRWHGLAWAPLVLMVYALGSMIWSHTYLAGVEAIRWFVLTLLLCLGLNTLTPKNLPIVLWSIHGGAVVASVWAALQFWFDFSLFPQGRNPASTFINRNFFAEYAVCVLPLSVWLLASLRTQRHMAWMTLSIALNVVTLMMTGMRSSLLALLLLLPVLGLVLVSYRQQLGFTSRSRRAAMWVGTVLTVGILGLGSLPGEIHEPDQLTLRTTALKRAFSRVVSLAEPEEYTIHSFSVRAVMWKATARMIMANPWTGVGAGAWEVQVPLYQAADATLETDYFVHNEVLQLLSEYGLLVGGMVLALVLAYWLHTAASTHALRGSDLQEAPLRAFALASLLALMVVSNAGFPWHLAGCSTLMVLCLGILAGSDARLNIQGGFFALEVQLSRVHTVLILAALLCCLALAIYLTNQATRAERHLVQAIHWVNSLRLPQRADAPSVARRRELALAAAHQGITINPHYRKLTAEVAEPFAAGGDWANAVWILASVAASRPHVYAIWTGLATGYARLGRHDQARQALMQVQRLKPDAISTFTLEIILLAAQGDTARATQLINAHFDLGRFDYDMVQAAYALGYKTGNWPLAIRAQMLRLVTWPQHAADAYFRLGQLYADPSLHDDAKALKAFRQGLDAVPIDEKDNFRSQVPPKYRSQM